MNMFLNDKPVLVSDLKIALMDLGDLDTIELDRIDEHGNLYFKVNTFELINPKG